MSQLSPAYDAALNTSALFDRSTVGKLSLIGPDAVQFLHNLCTNDIKSLHVGDGCEAFLCDPRAKVQHQLWVYRLENGLWLETVPGREAELYKTLDRYLISERVEMVDRTNDVSQYHFAGANSGSGLTFKVGLPPDLPEFSFTTATLTANLELNLTRRDILGVPGFDLRFDRQYQNDFAAKFLDSTIPLGTPDDYETLRIEACSPEFGKDIDDTRFVMEVANAPRAVSFAKGCFPGQEPIVMSRDRAGFVNRAFLGMKVLDGGPISHGTKLTRDGAEVGLITTSIDSPRLKAPIAIGYVKRGHQERGTKLKAGYQEVEVLGFPPLS